MQPVPPSGERSNREIQLDSKKRFKVSTLRWKLGPQVAHGSFGLTHFLYREEFDAWSAMTLYGMTLRLPNRFYPTANEWQTDPQAALQRHQQRVASYQYVPTCFPAHQKVHVNKRLLTCSHVMMSNEHKKHSLDWSLESLAPWPQNLHHWLERQSLHSQHSAGKL